MNDDDLSALLKGLPQPEPSAQLDEAILADAEKALATPEAANDEYYPGARKSFVHRHRVPLSLAATVLIAANLVLMEPAEKPASRVVEAEMAPVEVNMVEPAKLAAPPPEAPAIVAEVQGAQSAPRPAAAPPVVAAAPEPAAAPAESAPPPPAPAPAAVADARVPVQHVTVTGSSVKRELGPEMQKETGDPVSELKRIIALEQQGNLKEASAAWKALRQRHPDHPVDPGVKARLDALPAD